MLSYVKTLNGDASIELVERPNTTTREVAVDIDDLIFGSDFNDSIYVSDR